MSIFGLHARLSPEITDTSFFIIKHGGGSIMLCSKMNGAIYEAVVEENQLEKIFLFPAKESNLQWKGLGQTIFMC